MLGNCPAIFSSFVFQSTVYLPKNAKVRKVVNKTHPHLDRCKWKTQKCSRQNAKKLSFHLPRGVFWVQFFGLIGMLLLPGDGMMDLMFGGDFFGVGSF